RRRPQALQRLAPVGSGGDAMATRGQHSDDHLADRRAVVHGENRLRNSHATLFLALPPQHEPETCQGRKLTPPRRSPPLYSSQPAHGHCPAPAPLILSSERVLWCPHVACPWCRGLA